MTDFHNKMAELFQSMAGGLMEPDKAKWLYIDAVLTLERGNVSATARRLGMHRRTLQRIIQTQKERGK